jgi:biofilm PGA synthesis N-glycosyltransferase PgaC
MNMSAKYVIISPVRDEEAYIESTLESVVSQTLKPVRWIIVDDGSLDSTSKIVEKFVARHEWVELLRTGRDGDRQTGSAVMSAFNRGYASARNGIFDFVVKLDCDLKLAPDYFEGLLQRFEANPKLGIASGVYLEEQKGGWLPISMPAYHAAGASKVVRRKCFEEIGGFEPKRGWDTVDEIRARMRGWETRHFEDLRFYHLKPEGSGMGLLKTSAMRGEIFYLCGGTVPMFAAKALKETLGGRPPVVSGISMTFGFLRPFLQKWPRLVNSSEADLYRSLLKQRIFNQLPGFLYIRHGERPKKT